MAKRSVGKLWILSTFVFAAGFVAAGYLNYVQHQNAQADHAQLTGTIADLTYRVKQEQTATPSPTPSASPASTVLAAQSLVIHELGIKLSLAAPLTDLTYQAQQISGVAVANLTTAALIKGTTTCGPGALGSIVQRPLSYKPTSLAKLIATAGGQAYYYVAPTKACAKDPVSVAALASDKTALPGVLATLAAQ